MNQANKPDIVLIDDDDDLRDAVTQGLELDDLSVTAFATPEPAFDLIDRSMGGIVVCDIRLPGADGLDVMKKIAAIDPSLPVILITGHGDVAMAVEAMRDGAYDFITKPFAIADLSAVAKRALEKRRLVLENRSLREQLDAGTDLAARIVGRNPAIKHLRMEIQALADTDADVLILGDTGTGKEVVARALHDFSTRSGGNFVAINCAAIPAEIFESELFGHEAGAFTGAQKMRVGKLEHANGGTVFLDEIESMPLDLQAKLLRALEERAIERLGTNKTIPLDVRFVAATKADLKTASDQGKFRSDLYYRLNVITMSIPALRDRKDDIPILFFHLAREARARYRREIPEMTPQLEAELVAHDWPGNVRELRNTADRWVLGLWRSFSASAEPSDDASAVTGNLAERMAAFEKSVIETELRDAGGKLKPVYERLGISRKGLYDKLKKLGIQTSDDG